MNVTNVQNTGYLYKEVKPIKKEEERGIEEIIEKEKEEVIPVKKNDSRGVKEYNLNGHYREDYDTEKYDSKEHIDKFA